MQQQWCVFSNMCHCHQDNFNNIIIVVEKQTVQAVVPLLLLSVIPFGCSHSALGAELKPNAQLKTKYEIEVVFNGKSIDIQPLYRWQAIKSYKITKREKQKVATKQRLTKWGKNRKTWFNKAPWEMLVLDKWPQNKGKGGLYKLKVNREQVDTIRAGREQVDTIRVGRLIRYGWKHMGWAG